MLKQLNTEVFKESQDAEFLHGKAVELAVNFLPSNAPLVKHIVTSYQKHHSPCNDKIPEEKEVSEEVELFKAQNGVLSNKLAPIIKKIKETSIKLTPLDIQCNDYLADIFDDKEDQPSIHPQEKSENSQMLPDEKDNDYQTNYYNQPNTVYPTFPQKANIFSGEEKEKEKK